MAAVCQIVINNKGTMMDGEFIQGEDQTLAFKFEVKKRSDRLMNYFLISFFLVGLVFAFFYDTWLIAIGIGGLSLLAYYSVKIALPDSSLYQYVLSVILGIFMAQFIYQMHGLFEMHFFAFIGSTILITYQNWKLQIPLTLIVVVHHASFGYLQNIGITNAYFTQLDYFTLQSFIIHIMLAAVIFFICGLWAYQLKKYNEIHILQTIQMGELQKEAQLSIERKRSSDALEERNIILESITDAFIAVDNNWVVTYWNNTAERVLGRSKNETLGHNLWEIFTNLIDSNSSRKYHEAMKTRQAVHFEDYYPLMEKWHEISAYPSNKGLSLYFKDITDRKMSEMHLEALNENLQKHTKELAISNAELEQFAYVASHDLQEPLRMVTSFLTQLETKYGNIVDAKGKQYIHFAVDGAKRMRQIILDLLEFSRVGRTEDDLEEVDLNMLTNEILALYRKQIEEKGAIITFDNLPAIQTYKTPMRQVLQNLIGNGLKYQAPDVIPVINISVKEDKTHWQISVKDNGIGVDKAYFEKIFIIFQRLHNKEEYSGTGMGLAITKKIVESLGGKIWIESEEGKGSTFHFTILKTN
jgi:PAS domain S-box-containing protein